MPKQPITTEQAVLWAEDLCSRAEYAAGEIRDKLIRKGLTSAMADRIVDRLVASRFIDDSRFSRAFVRDKIQYARWGRQKVISALYQKRVARDVIKEAIDEVDEDEYLAGLVELLRAKARGIDEIDYNARIRLYRFAASRGFEPGVIGRAVDKLKNEG